MESMMPKPTPVMSPDVRLSGPSGLGIRATPEVAVSGVEPLFNPRRNLS